MKKCRICKLEKSSDEYYPRKITPKTSKDGLRGECRDCTLKESNDWAKSGKYKLLPGDYEKLVVEQGGLCGVCGSEDPSGGNPRVKRFAIDHNHSNNEVRGLLCNRCNRALGLFRDDPVLLQKAIDWVTLKREKRILRRKRVLFS